MSWFEKLEARYGYLAIPRLLSFVALLNGLVFVLQKLNPGYLNFLTLDPPAVMDGQIWRLVTHIFIPQIGRLLPDWIEVLVYLLFLNWLGAGLEMAIGAFRVNLYYLLGLVGTTAAAFLVGRGDGGFLLNNSLLFAFARLYPDMKIYFLMVIPIRVKWLAWASAAYILISLLEPGWANRVAILASLTNFAVFFGPAWIREIRNRKNAKHRMSIFTGEKDLHEALHQCAVCGETEITRPDLEFRVARNGSEYCTQHLSTGGNLEDAEKR